MLGTPTNTNISEHHHWLRRATGEHHSGEGKQATVSVAEPNPAPTAIQVMTTTRPTASERTQSDLPEIRTEDTSPTFSNTDSQSPESTFEGWTDHHHHHHLAEPVPNHGAVLIEGLLAPPGADLPQRPMTPRADLYHGQSSDTFGMTFGRKPTAAGWSHRSKPACCANKYEDQKHRMTMSWLERRGTA